MKLVTSSNILFERRDGTRIPLETSMRFIAEAGYRALDLCFVDQIFTPLPSEFLGENWERWTEAVGEHAASLGLEIEQCHLPIRDFCASKRHPRDEEVYMRRAVRAAQQLGIRVAVLHPSTQLNDEILRRAAARTMCPETGAPRDRSRSEAGAHKAEITHLVREASLARNVRYFRELLDFAGASTLHFAVENMWAEAAPGVPRYGNDPDELLELTEAVGDPRFGICWDSMHGSYEGIDQRKALACIGKRLKALHISDEFGREYIHRLPYTGRCPWEDVLAGLREANYRGNFDFELQHYLLDEPEENWGIRLRQSFALGQLMMSRCATEE